jgi:hypothetical protein
MYNAKRFPKIAPLELSPMPEVVTDPPAPPCSILHSQKQKSR